jgi:hypothetical protein
MSPVVAMVPVMPAAVVSLQGESLPRVVVFDVNGTLLDLRALNPLFAQAFGDAAVMSEWFSQVLRSALVATITGVYRDFEEIQREGR